ncbi:hypothetical protein FQN50_008253, partial [Emmonsiellopsis sp. PD_5]
AVAAAARSSAPASVSSVSSGVSTRSSTLASTRSTSSRRYPVSAPATAPTPAPATAPTPAPTPAPAPAAAAASPSHSRYTSGKSVIRTAPAQRPSRLVSKVSTESAISSSRNGSSDNLDQARAYNRRNVKSVKFGGTTVHEVERWIKPGVHSQGPPSAVGQLHGWRVTPLKEPDQDGEDAKYATYWCSMGSTQLSHAHSYDKPCGRSFCAWNEIAKVQYDLAMIARANPDSPTTGHRRPSSFRSTFRCLDSNGGSRAAAHRALPSGGLPRITSRLRPPIYALSNVMVASHQPNTWDFFRADSHAPERMVVGYQPKKPDRTPNFTLWSVMVVTGKPTARQFY